MSKKNDDSRKEAARVVREQIAREQRRRQQIFASIAAVAVLVVVVAAGWFIYSSQQPATVEIPKDAYQGVAFSEGTGPQHVELYLDFQCPACKAFESAADTSLQQQISAGKIKVTYYPVAILDHASLNDYSTRASASAGCAADEDKYLEYQRVLFANQPDEGTAGPTDDALITTGKAIGLGDSFEKCVKEKKYTGWTTKVTQNFEKRGLSSTPSVFVDNKQIKGKTIQETLDGMLSAIGVSTSASPSASTASPAASSSSSAAQ